MTIERRSRRTVAAVVYEPEQRYRLIRRADDSLPLEELEGYHRDANLRAHSGDGPSRPPRITGYSAVFYNSKDPGTEYPLWTGAVERVMPGAFDRSLKEKDDVRALFNHVPSQILGRSTAGTLDLSVDKRGYRYGLDAPDTQVARDLVASIERGDVDGSSFGFKVRSVRWDFTDDLEIRNLLDVEVFDVGPVTFPAYEATEVDVRGLELERDAYRERIRGFNLADQDAPQEDREARLGRHDRARRYFEVMEDVS